MIGAILQHHAAALLGAVAPVTSGSRLANPEWIAALWALPLIAMVVIGAHALRVWYVSRLAEAPLRRGIGLRSGWLRMLLKLTLRLGAIGALIVGLARPQGDGRQREHAPVGRDVAIVLDISRSMTARDLTPDRLGWAKDQIDRVLREAGGDRIALVAFGGTTLIKSPLTLDYEFIRMELDRLSWRDDPVGGTRIGDAIRRTLDEVFDTTDNRFRDIILITDGEDQESFPIEAARDAASRGVRIITIGLGSERGSPIPLDEQDAQSGNLRFAGREVSIGLDAELLRTISRITGGSFIFVGTGRLDLAREYRRLITLAPRTEADRAQFVIEYREDFQAYLLIAALLLMIEAAIGMASRS